uniref:AIG1-type G domain-containing protein n=2 Tax=Amphiprion percula TaxID=161767 RepID=A0A3P8UBW5_AMPPE
MSERYRESYYGSSPPDLRLILLGNIGCGKTSSADTILGQLSNVTPNAARSCQLRQGFTEGKNVTLVEAPRWYWNGGKMEDNVKKETERAVTLVAPGPHAILLLVPVSQFTEMEGLVPAVLAEVFGEKALDHTLVLLTCGDYLMGRTVEEYLQNEHPGLRQMIECCGGRYHVVNNRQRQDREQVQELLNKVDNMVQKNGVYYMKTAQERDLEKRVKDRKRELMESYKAQKEEKRKTFVSTSIPNTEMLDKGEENISYLESKRRREEMERRREEREEMERRVNVSQVSNGLHSTPVPEQQSGSESRDIRQANRTPSFRLNAEGAILSQIHEVKSTSKKISTFHHRISSFEERSPEASPTSPHSSIFSSSAAHSNPTFAASPSVLSSSTSSPSYSSSYSSSSSSFPELRLVLLGRSGSGKSAAGNAILGQKDFESCPDSLTAITQECEKKKALVEGRRVAVVDTPDWFNSECAPDEVRAQISSCVALSSPGPHAFLLCVPVDQPAKTELQALRALETVFGPEAVQKYTMLLFTYADRLKESGKAGNDSVEMYIASQRGDLLKLVEKCGDRFHVMETGRGVRERRNVAELLEKVERTVKEAGGQCYSSPAFQEAENKVRQKQVEIARERRGIKMKQERADVGQLSSERRELYSHMQPVAKAEEEVREDEIEKTRDEAEMSVKNMNIESLPPITLSSMSPSLLQSIMEKMGSSAKMVPKLLADGSVWVGEGAKKMKNSPVWGQVGSGAQNVQKMVVDSSVWGKVGATAGQVSKAVGDRVPKVVVDGSAWVGSGVKAAAASPMWEKVGSGAKSGAKLVADGSKRVGVGIGTGAKNLAQSPMWGKVGSGAKTGAKLMAENSVKVGAGIGAGAKKVAQSPVWGKVGSGAKAGAKMVAESSVWEKIGTTAKQVPKVVIGGALLGLVLGVFLGGVIGGAVGAAAGSAVTEVGRRKFSNKDTSEKTDEAARNVERALNNSVDAVVKQGEKVLKTE